MVGSSTVFPSLGLCRLPSMSDIPSAVTASDQEKCPAPGASVLAAPNFRIGVGDDVPTDRTYGRGVAVRVEGVIDMTSDKAPARAARVRSAPLVFGAGALVGVLGGMIGLGGAEFRLPLLIGVFGFAALSAVILNKAMSLVVVITALPARLAAVSFGELGSHWAIAVNLLAGSLLGAWAGASWAVRMRSATLYKVLAALMVGMAAALVATHTTAVATLHLPAGVQLVAGVVAGFGIGVVAAIMGVAGGELLIPTIVLLYGADIKLAGSLSLLVSLPTMLVAFARYSRDGSFAVLGANLRFTALMAGGSITGALLGGLLLGVIPDVVLIPALAVILLVSAVKVARHD